MLEVVRKWDGMGGVGAPIMELIFKTEQKRNMEKDGCGAAGDCSDPH